MLSSWFATIFDNAVAAAADRPLERVNYRGIKRLFLVHIEMGSETLYFSSKMYNYVSSGDERLYLPYLKEITDISESIGYMDTPSYNSNVTLLLFNKIYSDSGDSLLEYLVNNTVELKEIKIYELRMNSWDEEFINSEPGLLLFHGVIDQITNITESTFQLSCASLIYSLNTKFKANKLTKEEFPNIDPSFIGEIPNIVYGTVKKASCQLIDSGGRTTLTADMGSSDTSMAVSDVSGFPNIGEVLIDDEYITYSSIVGNTLQGCMRCIYGTTATVHTSGSTVSENVSQYVFLVANHPVHSLNYVYIDDNKIVNGITKYTGQTGDEFPGYPGKAIITADYDQLVKQEDNLNNKYGTSAYSAHWIDGDEQTNFDLSSVYRSTVFSGTRIASETHVHVLLGISPYPNTSTVMARLGPAAQSHSYTSDTEKVRFVFPGNLSESTDIQLRYVGAGPVHCYQVWKEVKIMPSVESVLNVNLLVDVKGYQDTSITSGLLEYPNHILEHIWTVILGRNSSEIGQSFSISEAKYITNSYKFGFLLNKMYDGSIYKLFKDLALQCKSRIHFYHGFLELLFQESSPSPNTGFLMLTKDNRSESPVFERTNMKSIANDIKGFYNPNYEKDLYFNHCIIEDIVSQSKYGKIVQEYNFGAITSEAHVNSILDWILNEKKEIKWTASTKAMSPALGLGFEDAFYFDDLNIVSGINFHVSEIYYDNTTVVLNGFEWI